MDYSLAKQLKEAGFPQDGNGKLNINDLHGIKHYIYSPTLLELIEACGDKFYQLTKEDDTRSLNNWRASSRDCVWKEDDSWGSTAEEAVARLWIELNKNK